VYDIIVLRPSGVRDSSANTQRGPSGEAADRAESDDLLARILITSWTLATGHTLPAGVGPQALTEDELISFWADDHMANASDAVCGPDPAANADCFCEDRGDGALIVVPPGVPSKGDIHPLPERLRGAFRPARCQVKSSRARAWTYLPDAPPQ
jgi:hypothetical protein